MILILSNAQDEHGYVIEHILRRQGIPVFRFLTEEFPRAVRLSFRPGSKTVDGCLSFGDVDLDLEEVTSVWYRRPEAAQLDDRLSPNVTCFARRESWAGLKGLYFHLQDRFWVNPPWNEASATSKPYQLRVAAAVGMNVPRTLITNDPEAARSFFGECGENVIYKLLLNGSLDALDHAGIIPTSRVLAEHLKDDERFAAAPCLFQENVAKKSELRINVIGQHVFATELLTQDLAAPGIDTRFNIFLDEVEHRPYTLPAAVELACRRLLDRLGLVFGAIDMILTPAGEYVFLEVNPSGQWLWIEPLTGQPLVDHFCQMLLHGGYDYPCPAGRQTNPDEIRELVDGFADGQRRRRQLAG